MEDGRRRWGNGRGSAGDVIDGGSDRLEGGWHKHGAGVRALDIGRVELVGVRG